ncbi:pentatricopeptide repeat-containing protein At2g13600-like [Macadamia integrifolia]|uniref:pentatricopeptide repeat-containing protein At2g13600-like n=1 Tax=Macadamia integrifolia TaxID=60698 RepID=UPI001C4EF1CA|nr:pentatricopeptide repeat-containing protein At2g13600-like [Macadamia integrifolia]
MGSPNALLNLYCERGNWRELTALYQQIRKQRFQPNSFTFSALLKPFSCAHPPPHQHGQSIHADANKRGFIGSDHYVTNALITVYCGHGSLQSARKLFDEIPVRSTVCWNTVISGFFHAGYCDGARKLYEEMQRLQQPPNDITWSAMVAGYSQNDQPENALRVFKQMRGEYDEMGSSFSPNSHIFATVFSSCGKVRDLGFGELVHGYVVKISTYIEDDVFVGSTLVDMYGKCGCLEQARLVFDSMVKRCVVTWSVLVATYVHNGCPVHAVEAFREMVCEGAEPNYVTLTTLVTACANTSSLILGKELHGFIIRKREMDLDVFISTSLIDMYGKCSYMVYARQIFEMSKPYLRCSGTAMWNATISGYVENNFLDDAWAVFRSMNQSGGTKPNSITMAIVLPLCARSAKLLYGKEIHCYTLKNGLDEETLVGNGLLDMYSRSGRLLLAENQFKKMNKKNRITCTSMIDGYGMHGDGKGAMRVFEDMVREQGVSPDHITFVALISACSHAGLVEEGLRYFKAMHRDYGIVPMEENYGSVVDLLARSGQLEEAINLIRKMPMKAGGSVWGALLGACRIHGYTEEAEHAAESLLKLVPNEGGFQKLLSSIYADMGKLDSVAEVRRGMRETSVLERKGFSWLETKEGIYGFSVGQ